MLQLLYKKPGAYTAGGASAAMLPLNDSQPLTIFAPTPQGGGVQKLYLSIPLS